MRLHDIPESLRRRRSSRRTVKINYREVKDKPFSPGNKLYDEFNSLKVRDRMIITGLKSRDELIHVFENVWNSTVDQTMSNRRYVHRIDEKLLLYKLRRVEDSPSLHSPSLQNPIGNGRRASY